MTVLGNIAIGTLYILILILYICRVEVARSTN